MAARSGLISTAELADILGQPELRLFDCTTYLEYQPEGSPIPYIAVPGKHTFEAGHIPAADFLDLQGEFSDQNTKLHFMMPPAAQLETAFGRHGIGMGSRVVLYSIGSATTSSRSMTVRWASGRKTNRCRSRRARLFDYAGTFGSGTIFGSGLFTR